MKKFFISVVVIIILLGAIYVFREDISDVLFKYIISENVEVSTIQANTYYRPNNYKYVQVTDDFVAKDKQHLLNIYYTIINSGMTNFTFICDNNYKNCLDDVATLSHSQAFLSNINSFVHPYNSFSSVETKYNMFGKVVVKVNHNYTDEQIEKINGKVKEIVSKNFNVTNDQREIIKNIHDYIIKTTKYDSDRSDKKIVNYKSNIAYGPLFEGYGLCGGYTDAMALFLDYYNIPNFKIVSENHIWNAVYIDNNWYHLDLTWDDPVNSSGKDVLEYTFFLITSDELSEIEKEQHVYDQNVFQEIAKNSSV